MLGSQRIQAAAGRLLGKCGQTGGTGWTGRTGPQADELDQSGAGKAIGTDSWSALRLRTVRIRSSAFMTARHARLVLPPGSDSSRHRSEKLTAALILEVPKFCERFSFHGSCHRLVWDVSKCPSQVPAAKLLKGSNGAQTFLKVQHVPSIGSGFPAPSSPVRGDGMSIQEGFSLPGHGSVSFPEISGRLYRIKGIYNL